MRYGCGKFYMSHSLASYLLTRYLNSALFALLSVVTGSFIPSAEAFIILCGAENPFAEKSVSFGFQRTVIIVSGFLTSP